MVTLNVAGLEHARARLAAAGKQIGPVLRGALNTTAAKARAERFVKPMANSISGKRLRAALKVSGRTPGALSRGLSRLVLALVFFTTRVGASTLSTKPAPDFGYAARPDARSRPVSSTRPA
jgi:hypothetical protein